MRRSHIVFACFIALALCACSSAPLPTAPSEAAASALNRDATAQSVVSAAVDTNGSEWPEFRRNDQRTGSNPYQTAITKENVSTLAPKWTKTTNGVFASPIVKSGVVYQADTSGNLYAWNLSTGAQQWAFAGTGPFIATPYYYDGALYTGAKGSGSTVPAKVYSIDASTGAENWEYDIPAGAQISASPLVAKGLVYEGVDAHDETANQCDANHQLIALKTTAATLVSALNLSPKGLTGADIWASPMLDESGHIYIATGNECTKTVVPFPNANAVIRIDPTKPTMGITWVTQSVGGPGDDLDFGSTPMSVNGMVIETGKDGYTYALNPATGTTVWRTQTGAAIGSSATDGTHVFIPTAQLQPVCAVGASCGAFEALNLSDGSLAWSIPVVQNSFGFSELAAPAVSNGVVYAAFNGSIWALDASTGATLWSYATPNTVVFSGLTVVNGGLLVGEYSSGGSFFCFTPGGK